MSASFSSTACLRREAGWLAKLPATVLCLSQLLKMFGTRSWHTAVADSYSNKSTTIIRSKTCTSSHLS